MYVQNGDCSFIPSVHAHNHVLLCGGSSLPTYYSQLLRSHHLSLTHLPVVQNRGQVKLILISATGLETKKVQSCKHIHL